MFGISPLGWIHTLGSLPAIPVAAYMVARHGRIVPRSTAGALYFASMLIGALSVFVIAHNPVSFGIGAATLLFLFMGYGLSRIRTPGRHVARYVETFCLSVTMFLLMVPTVSETLRRVPDGHPFVTDMKSPVLIGFQAGILVIFLVGVTLQMMHLRRQGRAIAG